MKRHLIAWDIETCPQPLCHFSEAQQARYEQELKRRRNKHPSEKIEASKRAVRALSPFLGWICCISAVRYDAQKDEMKRAVSYARDSRFQEAGLLEAFWEAVAKMPKGTTWVTFNGKRFDVPYLKARTLRHGLAATRHDLLDTYPYNHHPHADLSTEFKYVSLADVCDLLDVPTPKGEMTGADVGRAVEKGRIQDVIRYCEGDVIATMRCFLKSQPVLS